MIKKTDPIFTISLDFELFWGMRDVFTIEEYGENLREVENVSRDLLSIFKEYDIHATWATVGFIFYENDNIRDNLPKKLPNYKNSFLSPYKYIDENPNLEKIYHFAPQIIENIKKDKNQEIATHTFSHYYCLEEGQTEEEFREDIKHAIKTIKDKTNYDTFSIVFPRNQWNKEYLTILNELNILTYRGNEEYWIYNATTHEKKNHPLKRALRLSDAYFNISGDNSYKLKNLVTSKPYNIPSSRYLRPYSNKLSFLEPLRLKRIKNSMTHAAKNGELFHLWWHPHDFGLNREKNMQFLREILKHYKALNKKYNMKSLNMKEVGLKIGEINE